MNKIPQFVIDDIKNQASLKAMMAKLIGVHNTVLENIDKLNKKGDKGDAPTREEILAIIQPLLNEIANELHQKLPTIEDLKPLIPPVPTLPTIDEITKALKPHIKIDHEAIALKASKMIKPPKNGQDAVITDEMLAEAVQKHLKGKKLKAENVDGLENTFDTLLRRRGLPHGGGDSVMAGTGVTIIDSNGKKVISASGSALTIYTETPTGLIDGVNTTYTTVHTITNLFSLAINGQFLHPSEYSISGAGFTLAVALDASLSGKPFTIIYS